MNRKALIIEDDPEFVGEITDALTSLGHEWDTACSQEEALKRLKANTYDYALSNISIPARARNGHARIQNTENMLEQLGNLRLKHIPPMIIMSDYTAAGSLELTVDVMRLAMAMHSRGVVDVIAKPFPDKGRTLDRVIKKVLAGKVDRVRTTWPTSREPPRESPVRTDESPQKTATSDDRWASVPNEPIDLDGFMAMFCEQRSKENRLCRKRALLAAARHKTIKLPPLAMPHKHGRVNKYFTQDLLAAWQTFLDKGIDLPELLGTWK